MRHCRLDCSPIQVEYQAADATLSAGLQSEQTARASADEALAERVDTVQAKADGNAAAVQTVATAQANTAGKVEAGWYTKAQINGEGGGFGLAVTLAPDGSTLTSFVIDADVFAVLSRTAGVTSKRNPFIIKNGTVYMNHALMDTAEIGNVIAKYIDVQHLVGALIEGGSFRGGDIWLGENANGAFGAYGKRWNAGIDSNGRFYGSDVYFTNGTFQGNVLANSGTMNNVTIKENCSILGTLKVNQLEGDVSATRALPNNGALTVTPSSYDRTIYVSVFIAAGRYDSSITILVNGVSIGSLSVSPLLGGQTGAIADLKSAVFTYNLPANTSASISSSANIPSYSSATALVIVQKKDSSTFS